MIATQHNEPASITIFIATIARRLQHNHHALRKDNAQSRRRARRGAERIADASAPGVVASAPGAAASAPSVAASAPGAAASAQGAAASAQGAAAEAQGAAASAQGAAASAQGAATFPKTRLDLAWTPSAKVGIG